MAFESFSDFIAMEGHGPYVWTCYGVFFLLLVLTAWFSLKERRQVVLRQQQEQDLASVRQQAAGRSPLAAGSFQRISTTQSESSSKP